LQCNFTFFPTKADDNGMQNKPAKNQSGHNNNINVTEKYFLFINRSILSIMAIKI